MGCLWERTCGHCKNLFEAVTVGVCEVTDHRVEKTGDDEFAKSCPHYSTLVFVVELFRALVPLENSVI